MSQIFLGPSRSQTREYIDWQWPLSGVHSIIMVISAQPGEGGRVHALPLDSSTVAPSTPPLPSKTSERRLPLPEFFFFEQSIVARNRVGIGFSYWPARLQRLPIPWNRFLGSIKVKYTGTVYSLSLPVQRVQCPNPRSSYGS